MLSLAHDELIVVITTNRRTSSAADALEKLSQVASTTLACEVSIVRRRNQADGFGSPSEHVADRVCENLELVRLEADGIVHDVVVGGTSCALETAVCYIQSRRVRNMAQKLNRYAYLAGKSQNGRRWLRLDRR